MISAPSLRKLLKRIDAATGYDRDINIAIFERVYLKRFPDMIARGRDDRNRGRYEFDEDRQAWIYWNGAGTYREPPNYTSSIDEILELALKVFPGWTWSISQNQSERPSAHLAHPTENALLGKNSSEAEGANAALAMCGALVALLVHTMPTQLVDEVSER